MVWKKNKYNNGENKINIRVASGNILENRTEAICQLSVVFAIVLHVHGIVNQA